MLRKSLCVLVLIIAVSCTRSDPLDGSLWGWISGSYKEEWAQFIKDTREAEKMCFSYNGVRQIEVDNEQFSCPRFETIQWSIDSSLPNLNAALRGQCKDMSSKKVSAFCEIRGGQVSSIKYFKGEYGRQWSVCKGEIKKYEWPEGNRLFRESHVFDFGHIVKNLQEKDSFTIKGIVIWTIYDPEKSRINTKPRTIYSVGEVKRRYTCIARKGEVKSLAFSEVGTLTEREEKAMRPPSSWR